MAVNVVLKSVFDDKGIKNAVREFSDFGKGLGVAFAAATAATAAAAGALTAFGISAVKGAEEAAIAQRRLDQVGQSMGIFGSQAAAVTKRLGEFAEANELVVGVDADVIKSTQAKLLTFKNLAETANTVGGSMDRATMAALDLAATGFGSAETNAVQLGKALQDPIKGITALARAGVTFTETERDKIKALVQSGNILDAQNLILSAIEQQVGGTAEATASAFTKIELATNQVKDAIGEALLPVFEDFADEIVAITPELASALAPAAEEIAQIFRDQVLPAIKNLTNWLSSPQGTQTLKDLTQAVIDGIKFFFDFIRVIIENRDTIIRLSTVLAALVIIFKTVTGAAALYKAGLVLLTTQVTTATGVTTAFGAALKLLPWAALIIGAGLFVTSIADYANAVYGSKINTEGLTEAQAKNAIQVESLRRLLGQYEYALENSTAANRDLAKDGVAKVRDELARAEYSIKTTIGELNRFNNMNLGRIRGEIRESAGELNRFRNLLNTIVPPPPPPPPPLGETEAEKRQKAFEKVSKFIKDAQKDLAKAQDTYNDTIAKAQKKYAESVIKTEKDFAKKLSDIVQQSQDRLRSAFASATQTNVAQLFDTFKTEQQKRKEEFEKAQKDLESARQKLTEAGVELKETLSATDQRTKEEFRRATEKFEEAQKKLTKAEAELKETLSDPKRTEKQIRTATENLEEAREKLTKANVELKETLSATAKSTDKQITTATEKFNEAKTAFEKINAVVAKGLTKENPVEALLNSLREKLRSSQGLLSKAGQLASAGFSQTFIEQIVAAGTETGNELGQAILESTPETQRELQNLFSAIESTAETGMDALAKQIFEKSKFATRELATLYENTQTELAEALKQLKQDFDQEILDANTAFIDAIKTTRKAFNENIEGMKNDLGGLEKVIDDFNKKLGKVEAGAKTNIPSAATTGGGGDGAVGGLVGINIPISELSGATNILIDSFDDVTRVVQYLLERTEAARRFANQSALAGKTTEAMSALETSRITQAQANFLREQSSRAIGTVININVKTDSTQSLAMVGKTLGNTITKYVQTGGQVVVSPVG